MENGMEVPLKLKIELPYDPAIPLFDIYLEEKHGVKGYIHPNIHCRNVYSSQYMREP